MSSMSFTNILKFSSWCFPLLNSRLSLGQCPLHQFVYQFVTSLPFPSPCLTSYCWNLTRVRTGREGGSIALFTLLLKEKVIRETLPVCAVPGFRLLSFPSTVFISITWCYQGNFFLFTLVSVPQEGEGSVPRPGITVNLLYLAFRNSMWISLGPHRECCETVKSQTNEHLKVGVRPLGTCEWRSLP